VPSGNTGKFPGQGVDGDMTRQIHDGLEAMAGVQRDHGHLLARHGAVLDRVEEALTAHVTRGQASGKQIDDIQDTVDEMEAKIDLIVRRLGILKE
jgi:hypothetical protein